MYVEIDIERLRNDLKDYYGTAMFAGFSIAMMDLSTVEQASDEVLVKMAEKAKIDLRKYVV